jgi:hypothetical protein
MEYIRSSGSQITQQRGVYTLKNYHLIMLAEPTVIICEGFLSPTDATTIVEYVAVKGAPIVKDPAMAQAALQTYADKFPGRYFFAFACIGGVFLDPPEKAVLVKGANGPDVV